MDERRDPLPAAPADPAPPAARRRVAVVFGGRSTEHAVSCVSAGSVLAALDRDAWDVVPVGITPEGRWVLVADEPEKLAIRGGALPGVEESGTGVVLAGDPTRRGLVVQEPGRVPAPLAEVDVVFPVLHGPYGEDGTLQGLLELAGVPYVGSGVLASAASMDKGAMKALLRDAGLPVGPYVVLTPRAWDRDAEACLARVRGELALPVFVKPCRGGSSLGIVKVTDWDDLPAAVATARSHDPRVIVEQGIAGREVECGVLDAPGGERPRASALAEVRVTGDHAFYDFTAKYLDGSAECDVPADLPGEVADRVRDLAVTAFEAMGCEGLARVDFFVLDDGGVLVNEVNTMPGFTPTSMFPRMWAASGVDYPELVGLLLEDALRRGTGLR
ncbi:D-alanine--D-alanine ligase family protein [Vallicoccus soli]|uniref:D-alanine--D-alanine ligase n=1 Tax=Vallicoccus soli TaxID=2339232 RepID=A0A3A3ZNK1_9ACTN|nr:D-alanine--D-alanine ligase family protein [Vallicoccus soli]RJK98471.1 D-alanine--D-alanine ligase [Vallicoccus soli]